nr:hypothetical protein [Tanacetum cinerariifolium]
LERVVEDFTSVPDEQLLELLCDDDGLVSSVLSAVEEPMGDAFELNKGFGTPLQIRPVGWILEADWPDASPSKHLNETPVSILPRDSDLRLLFVVDDDDSEDHSLIELAGDMLDETADNTE